MEVKEIIRIVLGISTCLVIAGLDIAAGIYAIKAEDAQSHAKHVRIIFFECKKRTYMAYVYGMYAAAGLIVAHVLTNMLALCIAPSTKDGSISNSPSLTKYIGLLCFLASWLIFCPAIFAIVSAAKSNDSSKVQCGLSNHNFLFYGGLACFFHAFLSISYFANYGSVRFH